MLALSLFTTTNPSLQQMTGFPTEPVQGLLCNMLSHHATWGRGQSVVLEWHATAPSVPIGDPTGSRVQWVHNKCLTDNGCRRDTLPGLLLVRGGFRFKQTDGSGHWASCVLLIGALHWASALNCKLRQLPSYRKTLQQQQSVFSLGGGAGRFLLWHNTFFVVMILKVTMKGTFFH